jgi:YjbE family integral membrane protein
MASLNAGFFFDAFSIILIDLLLGGDNAIVIAMAVRSLPPKQRRIGTAAGAFGAVFLRVLLTFFAARLLRLSYIQLIGGLLILWIAVKLLSGDEDPAHVSPAASLRQAIWLIVLADITMSIDNILAVAAASKGNLPLLIFGLGLSISFVVFTSGILARLMNRYPVVVYLGAAILGRVGGQMIVADRWIDELFHPSRAVDITAQIVFAFGVVAVGLFRKKSARKKTA